MFTKQSRMLIVSKIFLKQDYKLDSKDIKDDTESMEFAKHFYNLDNYAQLADTSSQYHSYIFCLYDMAKK